MDATLDESGIFALPSLDEAPCHSTPIKGSKVPLPSTRSIFKVKYRQSTLVHNGGRSKNTQLEDEEAQESSERSYLKPFTDHVYTRKIESLGRNMDDTGNLRKRLETNETEESVTKIEEFDMRDKQATSFVELESGTLQKQRQEIQLLVSELKDRDRELSEMTESQQRQLDAWNQDRRRLDTLDAKCTQVQEEVQNKTVQLKKAFSNLKLLKSREATLIGDLKAVRATGEQLRADNSALREEDQQRKAKIEYLEESVQQLSASVGRLETREEELTTCVKLKERDIVSATGQLHELSERLQQLDLRCKECQDREKEAVKERNEWKKRYEQAATDLHTHAALLEKSNREVERLTQQNMSARQQLALVQKEASMREQCKNDLLESMKVKQERTDAQLKNFRELYERQLREVSELHKKLDSSQDRVSGLQTSLNEQGLSSFCLSGGRLSGGLESSPEKSITCQRLNLSPRDASSPAPLQHYKYSRRPDSDGASSGYQSQQLLETFVSQSKCSEPASRQQFSLQSQSSLDSSTGSRPVSMGYRQSTSRQEAKSGETSQKTTSSYESRSSRCETRDGAQMALPRPSSGRQSPSQETSLGRHSPPPRTSYVRQTYPSRDSTARSALPFGAAKGRQTLPPRTSDNRRMSPPRASTARCDSPIETSTGRCSPPPRMTNVRQMSPLRASTARCTSPITASAGRNSPPPRTTNVRHSAPLRASTATGRCASPFGASDGRQTPPPRPPAMKLVSPPRTSRANCSSPVGVSTGRHTPPPRLSDAIQNFPSRATTARCSSPFETSSGKPGHPLGISNTRQTSQSQTSSGSSSIQVKAAIPKVIPLADSAGSPQRENGYVVQSYSKQSENLVVEESLDGCKTTFSDIRKSLQFNDTNNTSLSDISKVKFNNYTNNDLTDMTSACPTAQLVSQERPVLTAHSPTVLPSDTGGRAVSGSSPTPVRDEEYEKQFEFSQKMCSFLEDVGEIDDSIWDEKGHVSFQQTDIPVEASPFSKLQKLLLESREMIEHLERSTDSPSQTPDSKTQNKEHSKNANLPK